MMEPAESMAAPVNDERERVISALSDIKGIAQKTAEALYNVGVRSPGDLAQYLTQRTNQQVVEDLREHGAKLSPWMIEKWNWEDQARERAERAKPAYDPLKEEKEDAEIAEAVEKSPRSLRWRQHAGFSIFFDYVTDEQTWQTRVYHDESGEETSLPGTETARWVNWILERAELSTVASYVSTEDEVAAEPTPTVSEVATPPTHATPYDVQLEILDVQVSEIGPSSDVPEKMLVARVCFQVSGPEAERHAADRIPFWIQVHAVDLESEASNLVAFERDQLESQVLEYTSQLKFPIPDLGRYELQSIVLLLPPGELMAFHRGPTFKVVP
jgi:hypothetical protein